MSAWTPSRRTNNTVIMEKIFVVGDWIMAVFQITDHHQKSIYEVHCPFCGKWVCDTSLDVGQIILPCRVCGRKIVVLNWGEGPFIFKERRKKARVRA